MLDHTILLFLFLAGDTEEDEDSIAASFPPLATLMKLLESKGEFYHFDDIFGSCGQTSGRASAS